MIHEVERDPVGVGFHLLEKPLVRRVKRCMCIRMLRFWRSVNDVLTWRGVVRRQEAEARFGVDLPFLCL